MAPQTAKVKPVSMWFDPSKTALVQFKSRGAKIGFYKKMKGQEAAWDNGNDMWWKNNGTLEKG